MKYFPRVLALFGVISFLSVLTPTAEACAPAALRGRTVTFTIQSGTGIFAKTGSFLLTTSKSGANYTIARIRGFTPATRGTYVYTPTSATTATLDFSDLGIKGFPYTGTFDVLEFTTPNAGNFHRVATSGADGEQSGTFVLTADKVDINKDGFTDILWEDTNGHLTMWQMNKYTFSKGISLDSLYDDNVGRSRDGAWRVVGQEDFDQDGNSDLLLQNSNDGTAKIWYLNKTNFVAEETLDFLGVPDASWHIAGIADFDGDCSLDAVFQSNDGHVQLVPNFRQTAFSEGITLNNGEAVTSAWHIIGVNDFNNDGKPDIAWRHSVNGYVGLWVMDGVNFVRSTVLPSVPRDKTWKVVGLGDFNRDGQMDFLIRKNTGAVGIWFMRASQFIGFSRVQKGVPISMNWQVVGPK